MVPIRGPINFPKIKKYKVVLITGGKNTWLEIRNMRINSRRIKV